MIASYNWGERRVTDKLEHLPKGIPEQALEGIPQDPDKRNYWRFLKEHNDRMPAETKDYVPRSFRRRSLVEIRSYLGLTSKTHYGSI